MKPAIPLFMTISAMIFEAGLTGCTGASSCCNGTAHTRDETPRDVTVLTNDLTPLRDAFNARSDQWRAFALVSTTCSECVLGAEAVEKEITHRYPANQLDAIVVWIPLLPSDNERAARASATIFPPNRATQF